MPTQTINLPKTDLKRLQRVAVSFGIPTDEIIAHILSDAAKFLASIPEESIDEYDNKEEILTSLDEALKDAKAGRLLSKLD